MGLCGNVANYSHKAEMKCKSLCSRGIIQRTKPRIHVFKTKPFHAATIYEYIVLSSSTFTNSSSFSEFTY